MIKFKPIKYKHYRKAQDLNRLIEKEEATDEDILLFAIDLIAEWDFKDADTGESLAVGPECLGELTIEQCAEINLGFAARMGVETEKAEVPKANA